MAGRKDFNELTPVQQAQVRRDRPDWPDHELLRHSYWVDDAGRVAKKRGDNLTAAAFKEYMDAPYIRIR